MARIIKRLLLIIICAASFYGVFPTKAEAATIDLQAGWSDVINLNDAAMTSKQNPNDWPQPSYAADNSGLYAAWAEPSSSNTKIRIKKYDGSSWTAIDNGSLNWSDIGISGYNMADPSLVIYKGSLYCAWKGQYADANRYALYIMRYDGIVSGTHKWTRVDGGGASGICFSSSPNAGNMYLLSHGDYLYITWDEIYITGGIEKKYNEIHVKRYDGSTWESIDGGTVEGINGNVLNNATFPYLAFYGDNLYASWQEIKLNDDGTSTGNKSQLVVKRYQYNGSTNKFEWVLVGGSIGSGGTVTGMNYDTNSNAAKPKLFIMNDKLYAIWAESNFLKIKNYNSDTGSWNAETNFTGPNVLYAMFDIAIYNNRLYAAYLLFDTSYPTYVLKYDGTNITNLNCGANKYISTSKGNSSNSPVILVYNHSLYTAWVEAATTSSYNIISRNMPFPYITAAAGSITEGEENGKIITVKLNGKNFAFTGTLNPNNWTVANLPSGVAKGSITRVDNNTVTIALSGNSAKDFDTDITNVTVSCTAGEYTNSSESGTLTSETGVTIKAKTCNITVSQQGSGSVNLNSAPLTTPYSSEFFMGNNITLTASAASGYHFAYWADTASNSIISDSSTYSFITGTDTNLQAVFKTDTAGKFNVLFKDPLGKILGTQTVNSGENATAPSDPYIIGYEFIGWDKSLKNITSDTVITAQFKRLETKYMLTVNNGTKLDGGTNGNQYDRPAEVFADSPPSGIKFAYWMLNGVIVSRKNPYSFYTIMEATNLTAAYENASASTSDKPLIALFPTVLSSADGKSIQFIANRDIVPDKCTLIESGILLYNGSLSGDLTLNTSGAIIAKVKNTSKNQFFVRKSNISSGETWHARAYMIYLDTASGNIITVYSTNTISKTAE